jgi:hypothetical protein
MKWVRRPGTRVGSTENQWLERRVRREPLDGTPYGLSVIELQSESEYNIHFS